MEERVCVVCGYIYGPERDDFEKCIPPEECVCPECGVRKYNMFEQE